MNIDFWKMHGASNDFIMIDDRKCLFPVEDGAWIKSIATRRTGVGCEGVILIQPSYTADIRMRFFNPDGSEVEMCGNGARCIARLAYDIGAAPAKMSIDTVAGELKAEVSEDFVKLYLTEPKDWNLDRKIQLGSDEYECFSVNTGVPHAVIIIEKLQAVDIRKLGSQVRYHDVFKPAGTNANFIHVESESRISVRTYERGVEDETLACGTGITASALVAAKLGLVKAPVTVVPASGDELIVDFSLTSAGAHNVALSGPAEYVFNGTLTYSR